MRETTGILIIIFFVLVNLIAYAESGAWYNLFATGFCSGAATSMIIDKTTR